MTPPVSDMAFTPSVKAVQARLGSRSHYARMEEGDGWGNTLTPELVAFLRERDSFYLVVPEKTAFFCIHGVFIVISVRYNRQVMFLTTHFLEDLDAAPNRPPCP